MYTRNDNNTFVTDVGNVRGTKQYLIEIRP